MNSIDNLVNELSDNFKKILTIDEIKEHPKLYWGGNGVGDRWAGKKFNYSVIYSNKTPKTYSENPDDKIPEEVLTEFLKNKNPTSGIIGIFPHSQRKKVQQRPIKRSIHREITAQSCVLCGSKSDIICDHKNDLYNDPRVLNTKTQLLSDFQPLCNHCNLQKRQVSKEEQRTGKIYSAKNIQRYRYPMEFPWEKKHYSTEDPQTKTDTYWFDPVDFDNKVYKYLLYVYPVVIELKKRKVP